MDRISTSLRRRPPDLLRLRHIAWPAGSVTAAALLAGLAGCSEEPESLSPSARPAITESLRAGLETAVHPGDGGGRAWLDPESDLMVEAGAEGRWILWYEAGPLGVAEGGVIYLQISPFWGWSTPQTADPEAFGYTEVTAEVDGVALSARTLDQQLLGIEVTAGHLTEGDRIRIDYGAGVLGARADRYADRRSPFWFWVDADGDGHRGLMDGVPTVEVVAGPAYQLVATLPTVARPGQAARLTLAFLDRAGSAGTGYAGEVILRVEGEGCPADPAFACRETGPPALPPTTSLAPDDGGVLSLDLVTDGEGIFRVVATSGAFEGRSNPLVVSSRLPRLLWGDLHGHSGLSDGTGTLEDYFTYARDVAALDVVALTDHDHWGMRPLARTPELWREIREATASFHRPEVFVTLLGYEWTNWLHGHRHVLYFEEDGPVLSSVDPLYETPPQLWEALRGRPALTFAHHSAGGPIATNWDYPPDPELEPVTEIVSVHGSSEAPDSPTPIYAPVPGNTVRDVVARGYKLGFIGSGDSHDGHPGLAHLASPSAGLAALWSERLTREGVLEALRARRVYATNGPRILLHATLAGEPAGSTLAPQRDTHLSALVVGTAEIERIDLVRGGEIAESLTVDGTIHRFDRRLQELRPGEVLYLRAVQEDGGAAWSSPFFLE